MAARPARQPSIAYLSYSTGEFDARTFRMADSSIHAGYRVRVYSRWHPGQAPREDRGDYELIRVPFDWRLAVPGLREGAWQRASAAMAAAAAQIAAGNPVAIPEPELRPPGPLTALASWLAPLGRAIRRSIGRPARQVLRRGLARFRGAGGPVQRLRRIARTPRRMARQWGRSIRAIPNRIVSRLLRPSEQLRRRLVQFPFGPLGWAAALERVAEPADIWHGMWAGSLPALVRMRSVHGGRALYDSRDIFMESREWAHLRRPIRAVLQALERRWSQSVDLVLTVNESYAVILERLLGVPRPPVVLNCPPRWTPPDPAPDLIREALGLDPEVGVALYQGRLQSDRGIEQSMEAILGVPNAVLALLGFGGLERPLREQISAPPYEGRVYLLPAVPPGELLEWTASADVSVMAIQPTSLNHEWTTPQKLFESLAAGTPVVASDLPGMAEIVQPIGAGLLVDPESPADIGTAIAQILQASSEEKAVLRSRVQAAAWDRFNWEAQEGTLLGLYRAQLADDRLVGLRPRTRRTRATGPMIRFVHEAAQVPAAGDVEVILDTTWIANGMSSEAGRVSVRDLAEGVLSSTDLATDAMTALDAWARDAEVVARTTLHGTSFWYGLRLQYWTWLVMAMLWHAILRRLLDAHPEITRLECPPDADPELIQVCGLVAEGSALSFETASPPSSIPDMEPERASRGVQHEPPADTLGRLLWKVWPPPRERRERALRRRLDRLERAGPGKLLVVEAHVPQRIDGPGGSRLMNAYLGPVVDRLVGTPLDPIEIDIRADPARDTDWKRLSGSRADRILAASVMADAGSEFSMAAARELGSNLAAAIATDTTPLDIGGLDLGPSLRAAVSKRVGASLRRRLREVAQIRGLLQRLQPAAILIADEYHRQDWLAAAAVEGVPVVAIQHGVIHASHVGYVHATRPPGLRLPARTYVFGHWERNLLVSRSVYRPDEVVVGGSPRLDLVRHDGTERANVRREIGVEHGRRMVVLSGTWGPLHRRFFYPIALRRLFDRPLPDVHLVVKLHPAELDDGPYRAVIENVAAAAGFKAPPISLVQSIDLYELLGAADAHLGIRSTVITESVVVGTPNLLAMGVLGADPLEYVRSGVAIPVRDGGDVLTGLDRALKQPMHEARRKAFIDEHFDPGGGAARIADDLLAWLVPEPDDGRAHGPSA
jgi:glycosyltransferase involved in cell wall biosynthesis